MFRKLYNNIRKHYHRYSFMANMLIAFSVAGLAFLGVMINMLEYKWILIWGLTLALMFGFGKLLDQEIDDLDKVREHQDDYNNQESFHNTQK